MAQIVTAANTFMVKEDYQDVLNKWKSNEEDFFSVTRLISAGTTPENNRYGSMTVHGRWVIAVLSSSEEN
jgi:hypothetical protein